MTSLIAASAFGGLAQSLRSKQVDAKNQARCPEALKEISGERSESNPFDAKELTFSR